MSKSADVHLTDADRILLVELADGSLRGRRRAEAEARLRELPDGTRMLERQRRIREVLRDGPGPVPSPAAGIATATAPIRTRSSLGWMPRVALAGAAAALAALFVALLVLPPADRSVVTQAADLSREPATSPAPRSEGAVLAADVEGVPFPNWNPKFGWEETGARSDVIGGRATETVFYEHEGHRLAYTILPGEPVSPSSDSRIVRRNGLEIALSRDPSHGGHDIAVFERDGHTCIVAGHVIRVSTLIELAAWTGDGTSRTA